jgi:arylsulfatase A-like enzyme
MRRAQLVGLWLALCACASAAAGCAPDAPQSVRVVLITLDTLRFDHWMPTEGGASHMPRTWDHAREGVRFTRFYVASSVTQPTHATIFTGLHPWEHGITRNGMVLSPEAPSLVEVLRSHGFSTEAVVASFPLSARFGFARGFDRYHDDFELEYRVGSPLWEGEWEVPEGEFYSPGNQISDQALAALDRAQGDKQFFWFHYFDPHSPYGSTLGKRLTKTNILRRKRADGMQAALELLERARDLYAQDVAFLDAALDRLLTRLADDADRFETHVFVVADHGESFGEGGALGHGFRLSPEQIHVPAFVLSPDVSPGVRHEVASTIDVAPTLLSLAGVANDGLQGRDLTRPSPGATRAFAMRKTFRRERGKEFNLDGRRTLGGLLFGEIDSEGRIHLGNGDGLETNANDLDTPDAERIVERFQSFEEKLDLHPPVEPLDPEVQRGLDALGYGS